MAADLPPGKWSAWLVGAWWPARPDAQAAGVSYWRNAGVLKSNEANDLRDERSRLAVNQGRTADDLMDRYWRGEQRLSAIVHQCDAKSRQSELVADAVSNLRDRLTEIARSGNDEIDQILSGKGSTGAKVAAVNAVIAEKNGSAPMREQLHCQISSTRRNGSSMQPSAVMRERGYASTARTWTHPHHHSLSPRTIWFPSPILHRRNHSSAMPTRCPTQCRRMIQLLQPHWSAMHVPNLADSQRTCPRRRQRIHHSSSAMPAQALAQFHRATPHHH